MLPPSSQQPYGEFKSILEQLVKMAAQGVEGSVLSIEVAKLQAWFQQQILSLDGSDLPPIVYQRVQSYQVEMNKQLRLLGMDAMFLKAARQSETAQQRREQVSDRLAVLIRYCEAVLEDAETRREGDAGTQE